MSLILDALNRARRDAEPVPGLDAGHSAKVRDGSRVFRYLPWLALALAVAVIVWLLLKPQQQEPAPTAVAQLSRNVGEALTSVKGELQERAAAARQPPPATGSSDAAGTPAGRQPAQAEAQPSEDPVTPPVPETAAIAESASTASSENAAREKPSAEVAQLYRDAASRPESTESTPAAAAQEPAAESQAKDAEEAAPASDEEPVDIKEILLRAQAEMNDGNLVEHPAPFLIDLSQQTKNEIPTIMYQRHDYAGDSSRSSVVLNGKTLRAGGNAAPGVTVDEILPDSVILSYGGTQFRLRALNSWVNL